LIILSFIYIFYMYPLDKTKGVYRFRLA